MPKSLRRTRLKSKAEAQRVERELIIKLNQKLKESVIPTFSKIIEGYCNNMIERGLSLKTVENTRMCLLAYTTDWKNRYVDEIKTEDVRAIINIKATHVSQSQQKNILKYIRGAFNYAVEIDVIKRNPTPVMKFKIGDKIKGVLTREQIKHFLTQAKIQNHEWYPIWVMALYTGMRNGELYALKWDRVNLEQRQILINSSWNSEDGFKSTKSGDDRIAEIAPDLIYVLKELRLKTYETGFVLPRIKDWESGCQAKVLQEFLKQIELPSIRFHDLRASWATVMLSLGIEPIKVMSMGGWSTMGTLEIYIRKAGVNTKGISDKLVLHDPVEKSGMLFFRSNLNIS